MRTFTFTLEVELFGIRHQQRATAPEVDAFPVARHPNTHTAQGLLASYRIIYLYFRETDSLEIVEGRVIEVWVTSRIMNISMGNNYYHTLSSTS